MLPGPEDVELDAMHPLQRLNDRAEFDDFRTRTEHQQNPQRFAGALYWPPLLFAADANRVASISLVSG